jgi:ureidoglycolate hydrolase
VEDFKQYGELISFDEQQPEPFQVVLGEAKAVGWRIAIKKTTAKELVELGRHPDSRESFEPMQGITLLCVAPAENPEVVEVFLLDQPVCLFKNIWHNTICLSVCSYLKITENYNVGSDTYQMKQKLAIGVVSGR